MRSPLRGTFVPLLFAALLIAAVWGYGSDLSPAPSSAEDVPGGYNDVTDEVLSFSEKSDNNQEVTDATDRLQSEEKYAPRIKEHDPISELGNINVLSGSENIEDDASSSAQLETDGDQDAEQDEEYIDDFAAVEDIVKMGEDVIRKDKNSTRGLKYFRLAGALGHSGALFTAASMLLSGENGVRRDVSSAVRFLRLAADAGQRDAQAFLGMLHASGLADRYGVEKNAAKSIVHWEFAAEMGSLYAATALGYRYKSGIDVPADCPTAAKLYRRAAKTIAADSSNWPSAQNFILGMPPLPPKLRNYERTRLEEDVVDGIPEEPAGDDDVLHYYRHSAGRGDVDALTTLGALHWFGGQGLQRNERRAERILNRAANAGNADAHAILGHVHMRKRGDKDTILAHFEASAKKGNKNGHYGLGMIYLHGLFDQEKDLPLAFTHFTEAVEGQHPEACFHLGMMYWKGLGVKASKPHAYRHFQHGARLGNMQSEFQLGTILLAGLPPVKTPDCEAAVLHFKSVAEKGEWKVIFDSAMTAFDSGDDFGALYRFMQAAHAGIELAQFNAALLLEKRPAGNISEIAHWDRERLIDEATELYQLSAQQGHSEALVRAGNLAFIEKKDYTSAVAAYEGGMDLKNAEAMFCLGWMYVRGLGVPQDRGLALRYLNLAKSTQAEALVPVSVAVVLLRVYWYWRDVAHSLGIDEYIGEQYLKMNSATEELLKEAKAFLESPSPEKLMSSVSNCWSSLEFDQDTLTVGVLLLALGLVIILRAWRLHTVVEDVDMDQDPHED